MSRYISIVFYIFIVFFQLSCSLPTSLPHLEALDTALLSNQINTQQTTEITLVLIITDLNLDDNTDLGPSFSELYLANVSKNSSQNYISIEDSMYGSNNNQLLITLNPEIIDSSDKIDICLVSGRPGVNQSFHIKNKWKCKSFLVSELFQMKREGYDFTLENKSVKIPTLNLRLHPHQ